MQEEELLMQLIHRLKASCFFSPVILRFRRKRSGCSTFPPVHIFFIPITVLGVIEPLGHVTVFQDQRVELRHVPDAHRAVVEVPRDLFLDVLVRALVFCV